jgi:photosynthetic reaction center cytochrome c subunit
MKVRDQFHRIMFVMAVNAIALAGLSWRAANVGAQEPTHPAASASPSGQEQQSSTTKPTTAGDAYMNVQVLKDIPSDQLLPSMRYITVALGVECEFCHVPKNYESDDKPEKATARKMMQMMFAINKDNFNGRREVTCYTCHRGVAHGANIPMLTATGVAPVMGAPAPTAAGAPSAQEHADGPAAPPQVPKVTVDEIVAKYTEALGGSAAIQKITTLEEKGSVELPFRGGMSAPAELVRKAPDKVLWVVRLPNGEVADGYNGTGGWQGRPGHAADEMTGDELTRAKEGAAFIPGLDLKQDFSRAQVAAIDKIRDQDTYRVIAFRKGGGQVRFYYDTQSGLLLRRSERIQSALGDLPEDTDFSDYRDVSGVKLPFTITVVTVQGSRTFKWDQIQANVPVEDTRFDKPAQKPAEKSGQ